MNPFRRQSTSFGTEEKDIIRCVPNQIEALRAFCGHGEHAAILEALRAVGPIVIHGEGGKFMIVQSGSHQLLIVHRESKRFYEMKPGACIGAETDDIAGVWGDLRLIEDDVEHTGYRT